MAGIRTIAAWVGALMISAAVMVVQAQAQDAPVWVQIEARPTLEEATERARLYAQRLPDVAGFAIGGRWHGVMVGPYPRAEAEARRDALIAQGLIPLDSYIANNSGLGAQFWPPAGSEIAQATPAEPAPQPEAAPAVAAPVVTSLPDETPAEARQTEAALTSDEKKDLQRALQADGFYAAAIDGSFGPGTRRAMAAWQSARGAAPTGILTTAQRAQLMQDFLAPLISVGMQPVEDRGAGIMIDLPLEVVRFAGHTPPFSRFEGTGTLPGAEVLLISQSGGRDRLAALYEVIQTLDILPPDGPRNLSRTGFVIEGQSPGRVSHAEMRLVGDAIKGFVLAWPTGDEPRRKRVLAAMQASFDPMGGVVLPDQPLDNPPDLLSGLALNGPKLTRSGFRADGHGHVVTNAQAVAQCGRVTLGDGSALEPVAIDERLGLVVMKGPAKPAAMVGFASQSLAAGTDVAVAGYPLGRAGGLPVLTYGQLSETGGAAGGGVFRMALVHQPGDIGGPVLDPAGRVVGALLASAEETRALPDALSVAADAASLTRLLQAAGVTPTTATDTTALSANALDRKAAELTVLVQCWAE